MGERTHGSVGSDARAEAVTRLYEREAGTVRRLVGRRARVPVDVLEDACQTAWERLWSHAEVSLQRDAAIRWLVVTASRHAWREYRNRLRVGARAVDGDAAVDIDHAADPLEIALDREQMQALIGRLGTLTVRERRFLAMHAAGMSYREIGAQTGSTLRTVERQILRGRRKLIHQTEHRGASRQGVDRVP